MQKLKENLDWFPETFYLNINRNGSNNLGSCQGLLLTIITLIFVFGYGTTKCQTLVNKSDMNVQYSTMLGAYGTNDMFTSQDGLVIAAMVTELDG